MKQTFASGARLRGGRPILPTASKPGRSSGHRHLGSALTADRNGVSRPSKDASPVRRLGTLAHSPGRSTTPVGISPMVTIRQNAISNFLASATIIVVLRAP
jgi:hypothetical protein